MLFFYKADNDFIIGSKSDNIYYVSGGCHKHTIYLVNNDGFCIVGTKICVYKKCMDVSKLEEAVTVGRLECPDKSIEVVRHKNHCYLIDLKDFRQVPEFQYSRVGYADALDFFSKVGYVKMPYYVIHEVKNSVLVWQADLMRFCRDWVLLAKYKKPQVKIVVVDINQRKIVAFEEEEESNASLEILRASVNSIDDIVKRLIEQKSK